MMIKLYNDIGVNWKNQRLKTKYNIIVTNIAFNTETKMLSFNTEGFTQQINNDGDEFGSSEKHSSDDEIWLETLDGKLISKYKTNSPYSVRMDYDKVKLRVGHPSLCRDQVIDLTEPNTLPSIATTKWDFAVNESIQTFVVPYTSRYKLEVWGQQGRWGGVNDGRGGYSVGEKQFNKGDILYVYTKENVDVRYGGKELNNRIIVAGCGGQGSEGKGGYGGGLVGGDGEKNGNSPNGGLGGTQTSKGSDGTGRPRLAGGSGYFYGGSGGLIIKGKGDDAEEILGASGGGSGYVGGVENGQTIAGNQSFVSPEGKIEVGHAGTGYVRITMLNVSPSINGSDIDLGDKNIAFSIIYQVGDANNDPLIVTEKLNANVLRVLNNAPKSQDIIINISNEQLYSLPLNQTNTITIQVDDGKGGISYRNYTFRRTNTAPIISNQDKNLGVITAIGEKYTVNDIEGNAVIIVEKLDNTSLRTYAAILGAEYATTIDNDTWIKLKNGQHIYSIEATDSNGSKSTRVFSFTKKENKIDFTLAKPFSTDIKASKILVTPSWELNGATAKIEVCNNAFDVNPTWEDITKQVLINRHYNFINTTKTADKWGVNIRIYIEKDQASSAEVSIKGFGGAFE